MGVLAYRIWRYRMGFIRVHCPYLQADVTLITDGAGDVENVVCPKFIPIVRRGHCIVKRERNAEAIGSSVIGNALASWMDTRSSSTVRTVFCDFFDPSKA
jgi:hypothetical protein